MNPYDFVRINWNAGVPRRRPRLHDRFAGYCGRLEGTITTLTPFFIPDRTGRSPKSFLTNANRQAVIPGSSLKGLVRSLVETIGPGCWLLYGSKYGKGRNDDVNYLNKLPKAFEPCPDRDGNLCPACRMFGLIGRGGVLQRGHVGFDDAVCDAPTVCEPLYTIILSGPKPRHKAFYLDEKEQRLAGRKFFYHHSRPPVDVGRWEPKGAASDRRQNDYIKPVGKASIFAFSCDFESLEDDELRLLLYALVLESGMRHKLGYAKPAGLGSVEINLTRVEITDDAVSRYRSGSQGSKIYQDTELRDFLDSHTAPYANDSSSATLQDLRRIWAWPGRSDLQYPARHWFNDHGDVRLNETP